MFTALNPLGALQFITAGATGDGPTGPIATGPVWIGATTVELVEIELVEILRIPKLSKSTFDKTFAKYAKVQSKLMSRNMGEKIKVASN